MPDENPGQEAELKRVVGTFGSFSMGYADVGADIFIALGLIALYASNASPLALALASVAYLATGLSYAELASTYPAAGGAQLYSMKAFGSLHGFIAGWGLMLDYTICIALFALASTGYLGYLTKIFLGSDILTISPNYGFTAIVLILTLMLLNIMGIHYSSRFNMVFVTLNIITLSSIILLGLPIVALNGSLQDWASRIVLLGKDPTWDTFAYAVSLAMVSYIGIESISQAAEETKHPSRVIPSATKAVIFAVIFFSVTLSLLSVTLLPADVTAKSVQSPMTQLALALPLIGVTMSLWVAFIGFTICYVSTNTGIIGVSRVTFSMGRLDLFPKAFRRLHPRFRTPYVTIILFSLIASLLILFNTFVPGEELLNLVASLYNFGALVAYMYVNLSLIVLRNRDPKPRAWKVPGSIKISRGGRIYVLPIPPLFGFISCAAVWIIIVGTHPYGRILGTAWFIIGVFVYVLHRKIRGLPLGGRVRE